MQYKKVESESEEEVGPKFEDNENKGQDFLESTMGLINKDKQIEGPSKEIADEFTKLFGGAKKRQKYEDKYQQ